MEAFPAAPAIPAHVPPELVLGFDPWEEIGAAGEGAYGRAAALHAETPPVAWAPRVGYLPGCWFPRRAEDLRRILGDTATFSSVGLTPFAQMMGEAWSLIPLEIDPPTHTTYRMLLNPLFTPQKVAELEPDIRALAGQLIDDVLADGACDFNSAFAERFPVLIFLKFMGWPIEEAPAFNAWTRRLVKSQDIGDVVAATHEIAGWLRGRIAERRATSADDFCSFALGCEIDGQPLTEDEVFGMCFLIFIAGLDTVTSALGFQFLHLARHPEQQAAIRADPSLIPQAVEEMLRAYSIVNMRRTVTRDVEVGGAPMKAGDMVLISTELANLDPAEWENPTAVDLDRSTRLHMAFSYGAHRCLGLHLARLELKIAIEEWLKRTPVFSTTDSPVTVRAAGVFGLEGLKLKWAA